VGLEGKVALITGGARGQGAEEARVLAGQGVHVFIADRDAEAGEALARSVPGAEFVALDVTREADWDAAVARITVRHGRLDILVNNAAVSHFGAIETIGIGKFMEVLAINLGGTLLGMQRALPAMKAAGGSMVNVSSISGLVGRPDQPAYLASKWALRGLTRAAALEFAPYGIRVNTIIPGLIATDMTLQAHGEAKIKARGAALPVGRAGLPADIASLLLFLVSPLGAACNGAEFVCDGGETAALRI
jgi:3alpha(or 20beta)-hydroxysteroid dehydrogenase